MAGAGQRPEEEVSEAEQQAMIQDMLDGSEVVYEVEGDNTSWASVTIRTPTGTIQGSPDLPMQTKSGELLTFQFDVGEFVYISAQNKDEYGSVTCRITVDGEVVSENTSSGAYGVASCEGRS